MTVKPGQYYLIWNESTLVQVLESGDYLSDTSSYVKYIETNNDSMRNEEEGWVFTISLLDGKRVYKKNLELTLLGMKL